MSRQMRRLVALDPVARTARVLPAGRDPGRAQSRCREAPPSPPPRRHVDVEPRHARRHDRQQLVRARLIGLRHDDRPRPRARGPVVGRLARALGPRRADLRGSLGDTLAARRDPRRAAAILRTTNGRSPTTSRALAQVGRLRLDRLPPERVRPREPRGRLRRHARHDRRRRPSGSWSSRADVFGVGHFDTVATRSTPRRTALTRGRRRSRWSIARSSDSPAASTRHGGCRGDRGRPRGTALRHRLRRKARRGARPARRSRKPGGDTARLPGAARRVPAEQQRCPRCAKPALARSPPESAPRGRSRSSRTPRSRRAARRVRRALPRGARPPRAERRLLRPLLRGLPAHPPVRGPPRPGGARRCPRSPRRSPARRRVRRRELVRARRRPRPQRVQSPVFGDDLYAAMRKVKHYSTRMAG